MRKHLYASVFWGFLVSLACWATTATAQTEIPGFNAGDNAFGATGAEASPVALLAEFTAAKGNLPARLFITATIKTGWHIYSITQSPGGPIKTEIKLHPSDKFKLLGDFRAYPKPKVEQQPVEFPGIDLESHEGKVTWYAPLELAAGVDPATLTIDGQVSFQSCLAESCHAPQTIPFTANLGQGVDIPADTHPAAVPVAVKRVKPNRLPKAGEQKKIKCRKQNGIFKGSRFAVDPTRLGFFRRTDS